MPYFALFYDVVEDFTNRRMPFRPDHLQHVQDAHRRGELLLAGALLEPVSALLVFRAGDASVAADFAARDPYVVQGLVTSWHVRPYMQVIATQPGEAALVSTQ